MCKTVGSPIRKATYPLFNGSVISHDIRTRCNAYTTQTLELRLSITSNQLYLNVSDQDAELPSSDLLVAGRGEFPGEGPGDEPGGGVVSIGRAGSEEVIGNM